MLLGCYYCFYKLCNFIVWNWPASILTECLLGAWFSYCKNGSGSLLIELHILVSLLFSYCKTLQKLLNYFQVFILIALGSSIIGEQFNYYYFSLSLIVLPDCRGTNATPLSFQSSFLFCQVWTDNGICLLDSLPFQVSTENLFVK